MAGLVSILVLGLVGHCVSKPPPMDPDMAELAAAVRASCAADTGADVTVVERVNDGADIPNDPALKCYIKCTMETAGMMSEGEVDVEAVLALLPDSLRATTEPAIRSCGTQSGADHCEIAYKTQLCWQKANKDDYFLI